MSEACQRSTFRLFSCLFVVGLPKETVKVRAWIAAGANND
jgi:hypothetical protein